MRFGRTNARSRDTLVTVRQLPSGRDAYENGRIKTSEFTEFSFFGDVKDMRSESKQGGSKILNERMIMIMADSESVTDVNISDTLTLDTSADTFEVVDKYDVDFRFTSAIIAKYVR